MCTSCCGGVVDLVYSLFEAFVWITMKKDAKDCSVTEAYCCHCHYHEFLVAQNLMSADVFFLIFFLMMMLQVCWVIERVIVMFWGTRYQYF